MKESRLRFIALGRWVQRLCLEHPLPQRVVRVPGGRAGVRRPRGDRTQSSLGVVAVGPQAIAGQIPVGVVRVGHLGARAAHRLAEAIEPVAAAVDRVAATRGLAIERLRARVPVPIGVIPEARLASRGIEPGDPAHGVITHAPRGVRARDAAVHRIAVPRLEQVLRQAGDAPGRVVHVVGEFGGGHPPGRVIASAGNQPRDEGPVPGGGLAHRVPGDAGDQRAAVPAQLHQAARGVVIVQQHVAVGVGDAGELAGSGVAVGDLLGQAAGQGLGLDDDTAEGVAAVGGGAAAVDDLGQVPLAAGREVVTQGGGLAVGEGDQRRTAQGVALDLGGLAQGIGDGTRQAHGVVLGALGADVGAALRGGVALGIPGVAGGHALEVAGLGDGVQRVVGESGGGVGGVGDGLGAAQGVQAVPGALVQAVGLGDEFAVGVVSEGAGLVGAVGPGGEAVEVVDGARCHPGDGAGAVPDLLGRAIAHRVQGVAAALAAGIAPAGKTVGCVVRIGQHQAGGQGQRLEQARWLVGQGGDPLAADGLGE
ncbi:hypothetical protein APY03_3941 [Variovorax sp. WDL1]|nr:hypothetical protein APY03_3941 [Variovorax sp. WDL1]